MDSYMFREVGTFLGSGKPPSYSSSDSSSLLSEFSFPKSLALSSSGHILILDSVSCDIKIFEHGVVRKFAGNRDGYSDGLSLPSSNPSSSSSNSNPLSSSNSIHPPISNNSQVASFSKPHEILLSANGDLFVSDSGNHAIRVISDGTVSTFAGGVGRGNKNGLIKAGANFDTPTSVALIPSSLDLIVCDSGNHCLRIISNCVVKDWAGVSGEAGMSDGFRLGGAKFRSPSSIVSTSTGDILVADSKNHYIRCISEDYVSVFAGDGTPRYMDGPNLHARFDTPVHLSLIPHTGDLVIVDQGNHRIRLCSNGMVYTIAGAAGFVTTWSGSPSNSTSSSSGTSHNNNSSNSNTNPQGFKDGSCQKAALFNTPSSALYLPTGQLLVADSFNHRIRFIKNESHVIIPDLSICVDLHFKGKNASFSSIFGDFLLDSFPNQAWHLHKPIISQRCQALVREEVRNKLWSVASKIPGSTILTASSPHSSLSSSSNTTYSTPSNITLYNFPTNHCNFSIEAQKRFLDFIYCDSLPEGQYGSSSNSVLLWIEIHEIATIVQLDRLAAHCKWRVAFLMQQNSSLQSMDYNPLVNSFANIVFHVLFFLPSFAETLLEILASFKNMAIFNSSNGIQNPSSSSSSNNSTTLSDTKKGINNSRISNSNYQDGQSVLLQATHAEWIKWQQNFAPVVGLSSNTSSPISYNPQYSGSFSSTSPRGGGGGGGGGDGGGSGPSFSYSTNSSSNYSTSTQSYSNSSTLSTNSFESSINSFFSKLTQKSMMTVHSVPKPTSRPTGFLVTALEVMCPKGPGVIPPIPSDLKIVIGTSHTFYVHSCVLVSRWPLVFWWFFATRTHDFDPNKGDYSTFYIAEYFSKESLKLSSSSSSSSPNYDNNKKSNSTNQTPSIAQNLPLNPDEAMASNQPSLSISTLTGMLRYFYTGKLDAIHTVEDCKIIASQSTLLRLDRNQAGAILISHCQRRLSSISAIPSSSSKENDKDKCIIN